MNRAIAVAEIDGPDAGLVILDVELQLIERMSGVRGFAITGDPNVSFDPTKTTTITTGQLIEVDGNQGIVRILPEEA